jgi:predicted ribonuclease YlaK
VVAVLPWTVVVELDRLKGRHEPAVARAARDALRWVARWMAESHAGFVRVQTHEVRGGGGDQGQRGLG